MTKKEKYPIPRSPPAYRHLLIFSGCSADLCKMQDVLPVTEYGNEDTLTEG